MRSCCSRGSARWRFCNLQVVPSGDISLMPHAWTTSTSKSSLSVRIIAGGQADPPMMVRLNDENRRPFCFMWLIRPSHTVGTPAENVTRSFSNSS